MNSIQRAQFFNQCTAYVRLNDQLQRVLSGYYYNYPYHNYNKHNYYSYINHYNYHNYCNFYNNYAFNQRYLNQQTRYAHALVPYQSAQQQIMPPPYNGGVTLKGEPAGYLEYNTTENATEATNPADMNYAVVPVYNTQHVAMSNYTSVTTPNYTNYFESNAELPQAGCSSNNADPTILNTPAKPKRPYRKRKKVLEYSIRKRRMPVGDTIYIEDTPPSSPLPTLTDSDLQILDVPENSLNNITAEDIINEPVINDELLEEYYNTIGTLSEYLTNTD